ncbi:ABC-F family ATP-binding cassette domain-containing protein [Williamwhitmania taraxaci]|uniref:Probable ATP-binding protein YbiT n=2 Tax=Williamwhitmania taraxaci TaxID=1640674 RepID=A0A1G6Q5F9_9BACT|nr:ABC-F family ATP-binding cassette domain-containing protein [Williamwhitmania taraxaci]SDC87548.1 ATP-binding cassette, subfamily F, member 3 [Williamwhitmania taraxaci]
MVSVNDVWVSFGGFDLLKGISFMINPRDRIGLVGRNGAGKSTLLKILYGMQKPTSGNISSVSGSTLGYLAQTIEVKDGRTVMEEASLAFSDVLEMEKEMEYLSHEVSTRTDYESDEYSKLVERYSDVNERHAMVGGASLEGEVEKTLLGLGFERKDFVRQTSEFSGGWRMRIELAKILLQRPNLILLDEPTNHLDIESIQWLEDYLTEYPGAVVLISHDRAFLNNVTNRTVEVVLGKVHDYKASYSHYMELRKERREQQMAAYLNQRKMIEDTEDFINRFRSKATKAVQVQSRIKQLDKVERLEIDEEDTSAMNIKFPAAPRSGQVVMEAEDLTKAFGKHVVFSDVNIKIERGEKVAFVGRNGEGKSTLSRIAVGDLEATKGFAKMGHNVLVGYFAQNQDDLMDGNMTVFETIDDIAVGDIRTKIRDILGAFLFRGSDVDKKVKVLSGGERSRLAMAKLMFQPYNLLILDEPTNHMDIVSKDILKEALRKYDGTMIIVSHDREFLDGLVDKLFEFRGGKVKEHLGGIYDFLKRRKMESLKELERKTVAQQTESAAKSTGENKLSYAERKEMDKVIRKVVTRITDCEKKIEAKEAEIAKIDILLANPEQNTPNQSVSDVFRHYQELKHEVEGLLADWELLNSEKEKLEQERGII